MSSTPDTRDMATSLQSALEYHRLFQSALKYHKAGHFDQAQALCQQVLQAKPNHAKALHLLGLIAHQRGEEDSAIELLGKAVQASPGNVVYQYNLGTVYSALHKTDEAIACYKRALEIRPDDAESLNNLGNTYKDHGRLAEAVDCYHKVLALRPDDTTALNNLGTAFHGQDRLDEAIDCYRKVLSIRPDHAAAYNNLGVTLAGQGKSDEALASYRKAIEIAPNYAEAHNNTGNIHKDRGNLDEALACFRRAAANKPDYAEAWYNCGNTFKDLGDIAAAMDCYRKALALKPNDTDAHRICSNNLLAAHYASLPAPAMLYAEHLKFAERFEAPLRSSWKPHENRHDPDKRLRVGYVSPDFRDHAVAYFVEPVLDHHDKSKVEIFCYYNNTRHDDFTERLMAAADHWLPCKELSNERLAERIRADGIDILVDLAGHTGENRLLTFAHKPAPVQVTWLGYIDTTGLSAMDYRLTHIDTDPPGNEAYYSETLYRLPGRFWWCYRPRAGMPEVAPSPFLANGFVTFGSTNNFAKLSPETLAVWVEILRAVPESRLIVADVPNGTPRESLVARFANLGVDHQRLIIHGKLPVTRFWDLHHQIDIALDPFPHNGGTTTCDALWLGVPVVALTGQSFVSRMGYALLKNIGLPELAATDTREYIGIATSLARDPQRLATLRAGMRARFETSPLRDETGFTRTLEAAYREMWKRWCASD